jgi:mRNA interferase YafQ
MLELKISKKFKKDLKRLTKQGLDMSLLDAVILKLRNQEKLEPSHCDHALSGKYIDFRECHVRSNWLLIYMVDKDKIVLTASRTGTHAELFGL